MTIVERIAKLQNDIETYGVATYYNNYFKNTKGIEGWHNITFYKKVESKNTGNNVGIVCIGNSIPYIKIEVMDCYHNSTYIIIGTEVWYPKTQREATNEEIEKAIKFFEDKIEERKAILDRAKGNRDLMAIGETIRIKFKEVIVNNPSYSNIGYCNGLKFIDKNNGRVGVIVLDKNKFNEVSFKMVYPMSHTETYDVNYFEDGLTDHYYGRDEKWEDVVRYFLSSL